MWTSPGWKRPDLLLRLLNMESQPDDRPYLGRRTKASRSRMLQLIGAIQGAEATLAQAIVEKPNRNLWSDCPGELADSLEAVGEILQRYPMQPTVEISGRYGEGGLHFDSVAGSSRTAGEQLAVWDITTLAQRKQLQLVRQCSCGNWFFAVRSDQRACSPACRHRIYEQTDAFKAKRRSYMRDYYALKQSGKVK